MVKKLITGLAFSLMATLLFSQGNANAFHLYPNYTQYLKNRAVPTKKAFFFKAQTNEKIVCFSFDDGPNFPKTEKLIAFLKQRKCPAVFFLIGEQMKSARIDVYKDPLFEIGCHGFHHDLYSQSTNQESLRADVQAVLNVHEKFGFDAKFFRPPFGVINKHLAKIMNDLNIKGVLWSLDSQDFLMRPNRDILNDINTYLSSGDIILFHETLDLALLSDILDLVHKKGFKVVKLSELMKYPNVIP